MQRRCDVIVLCLDAPTENDRRAYAIAEFMGAAVEFTSVRSLASQPPHASDGTAAKSCLIVAADTLASAPDATSVEPEDLRRRIHASANHIVLYGFSTSDSHATLLTAWSSSALSCIRPLADSTAFAVNDGFRQFCSALSGVSLGRVDASTDHGFVSASPESQLDTIVRVGDAPFLARIASRGGHVYFVGTRELADLNESVSRGSALLRWFSRLAPLMMILRGTLGDRVWRNLSPRACFIIDDPLLSARYGFLECRRLVEAMRAHRFFPCIAFIPWNHGRSRKDIAALLAAQYRGPFLCVHGCDHTRAEFETTNRSTLEAKASLALERMQHQVRVADVPFDDVMVFPQGLFSSEAIAALSACGYLAAVNSDVCPSNASPSSLTLRDLLDVAVTKFADFPLFGRRYPRDLGEFAFDLFVGKPALVVEHHGYFRHGYGELASFVAGLNAIEPHLEWTSLGRACAGASLTRTNGDGDTEVRFFTTRFMLVNDGLGPKAYILTRPLASTGEPPTASVNDAEWPCETTATQLTIRLTIAPGETAAVRVGGSGLGRRPTPLAPGAGGAATVRLRRYLSEFRDNYVDTNPVLHAVVAAARSLRRDVTGQAAAPRAANT